MGIEIERKYIISLDGLDNISSMKEYTKSEIEQIYLESEGVTHRIRKRVYPEKTVYTETKKTRIDKISALEEEREISSEEYEALRGKIARGTSVLKKTRHTFTENGQVFEIDVYPQWKKSAIMETELENKEMKAKIPSFIRIIKEVSGEKAYSNASMAKNFPDES